MLRFSKKSRYGFWFLGVLAIFCLYQPAVAQSRRVPQKTNPVPPAEQTAPVESKPAVTEREDEEDKSPVKISSLMVVGEVQHDFAIYKSNDIDNAQKEFIRFLKLVTKSAPEMTRGEKKMSYAEAKEQAKKETDKFILWMGFAAKADGYGNMYIDYIQYAVIKPQSGKILTLAQVTPGQSSVVGSIKQIRVDRRRSSASALSEMKDGARQIAMILLRGGWLN